MIQAADQDVSSGTPGKYARFPGDLETLKRSFADEGYLIFENVVSKEKLAHLHVGILDAFERAKQSGGLFSGGGLISGHLNCFPGEGSRFVYDALQERGIIDLIRALFPNAVRAPNVGCNLNLPNSVAQHYHVDGPFMHAFVVCNIAVVDTDLTNGAIDVLPRTNKKFYKYWRFSLERPYRWTTRLSMKQGDVLVRTSNLWHRGMPNHSATARPMLALTWEDGGSTLDDPFLGFGGAITFRQNWYRSSLMGQLRERTFVAAPFTYSAYRFVRSLIGNKGYSA